MWLLCTLSKWHHAITAIFQILISDFKFLLSEYNELFLCSCYFAHCRTGKDSIKYLPSMVLQRNNWLINITNISSMVVAKIRRNQHPLSRLVNHVMYAYTVILLSRE
jgi:hypothetical protein